MKKLQFRIQRVPIEDENLNLTFYQLHNRSRRWFLNIIPYWSKWELQHTGLGEKSCKQVITSLTKDLRFDEWEEILG